MGSFGDLIEGAYRMKSSKARRMKQVEQVRRKERKKEKDARKKDAEKRRDKLRAITKEEARQTFRDLVMLTRKHFNTDVFKRENDLVQVINMDDYACDLCDHFKHQECEGRGLVGRAVLECLIDHHTDESDGR